jgi:GNAT superfamily N-acetyltransferase
MKLIPTVPQLPKTQLKLSKTCPENANEYSEFLQAFFVKSSQGKLRVPPDVLKTLKGAEIRDPTTNTLIGIVFSAYMGTLLKTSVGLIPWLCVHPDWRKKGIADLLLHAINFYAERPIHFFRNDGWLKSPLPPLWNEGRIQRKRNPFRPQIQLQRIPLTTVIDRIKSAWTTKNPTGLFFYEPRRSLVAVWSYRSTLLITHPTFEEINQKRIAEILFWVGPETYETTLHIEAMIDSLPYDSIEAPHTLPHMDGWSSAGQSSWSIYGLDPGIPTRPVLSLLVS